MSESLIGLDSQSPMDNASGQMDNASGVKTWTFETLIFSRYHD